MEEIQAKYYIAYGSNLNLKQMEMRCREAEPLAVAELKGYQLLFKGYDPYNAHATVEPKENSTVPVLIWKIGHEDEKRLDRYEGVPRYYVKENISIEYQGMEVEAMLYVMAPDYDYGIPSKEYLEAVMQGYIDNNLDMDCLHNALEYSLEITEKQTESIRALLEKMELEYMQDANDVFKMQQ